MALAASTVDFSIVRMAKPSSVTVCVSDVRRFRARSTLLSHIGTATRSMVVLH